MHATPITLDELGFTGSGLHRPECVLSGRKGALYVSDWRGGITILSPDGSQRELLAREHGPLAGDDAPPVQPNGFAIDRDGLLSDSLATFRSPVAGLPPSHWEWT